MIVYFMRHGAALGQGEWRGSDSSRPLSDAGVADLETALPALEKAGLGVRSIQSSPNVRAIQTAEIIARIFEGVPVRQIASLAAGASIASYRNVIRAEKGGGPLLLIGHMPDLAVAASHLSGKASLLESGFKPGDILAVESGDIENTWGNGRVLWQKRLEEWR